MKTLISFTIVIVAWVSNGILATETSGGPWSRVSLFVLYQHHALIGRSFLNQSGTVRIKCAALCLRHSRCLSFNHDDINGICQLNAARKEEFPASYKYYDGFSYLDGQSNKAKTLQEETMMVEHQTPQAQTTTKRATTVSTKLSTPTPDVITSAKAVDTEGPTVHCPYDVFGLTNNSNARTSIQLWEGNISAYDDVDGYIPHRLITCMDDDDEGRSVVSGDSFKLGTTPVTCMTSDVAGNPGQCTFRVTITVCNTTHLGMESGAVADTNITAWNVLNKDYVNYGPAQARFNSHSSWCWDSHTAWIQVIFNHKVDIYGLIIQDGYRPSARVTSFQIIYINDADTWSSMKEPDWSRKDYLCDRISDRQDVFVSIQTATQSMIQSNIIRIYPKVALNEEYPCMRFEVLTCN